MPHISCGLACVPRYRGDSVKQTSLVYTTFQPIRRVSSMRPHVLWGGRRKCANSASLLHARPVVMKLHLVQPAGRAVSVYEASYCHHAHVVLGCARRVGVSDLILGTGSWHIVMVHRTASFSLGSLASCWHSLLLVLMQGLAVAVPRWTAWAVHGWQLPCIHCNMILARHKLIRWNHDAAAWGLLRAGHCCI